MIFILSLLFEELCNYSGIIKSFNFGIYIMMQLVEGFRDNIILDSFMEQSGGEF